MRYALSYRDVEKLMQERGVDVENGSNKAALEEYNAENDTDIEIRKVTYLNNIVEQDHSGIKRTVRPMLGFKEFRSASVTLRGIELVRMIRKGQLENEGGVSQTSSKIFYSLSA